MMTPPPSLPSWRPPARLLAVTLGGLLLLALLLALGAWQLQRLAWKQGLIERIARTQAAPPQDLPPPAEWPSLRAATHEYQRVRLQGRFEHQRETLVQASTVLGPGWWVLTPMQLADGHWVLVNRGFVDAEHRNPAQRNAAATEAQVEGLLRFSEPRGRLWLKNMPAEQRWYSRDVEAIGAAQALPVSQLAPFFIDASAAADDAHWPRTGLTVLSFSNNHLMYALTWFCLAAGVALALVWLWRHERRRAYGEAELEADA